MLCFLCLTEAQPSGRSIPSPAITVYMGNAVCLVHLNTIRGLPADHNTGGTQIPAAPPPQIPTQATAPAAELQESEAHTRCTDCDQYTEVHYQPDVPHCSCGAALIEGTCEATLDDEQMAQLIARIAPNA